jgi:hypothetical protein
MPLSTTEIDTLLTSWASSAAYMSAHSAYSATGANELSGGSYARVAVTWGSASGGSISLSGTPYSINAPASSSVGWVGFWTASSGGTFLGMIPGGNYTAYTFTAPASTDTVLAPGSATYATNQTVVVFPTAGSTIPAGLTAGTVYYAISVSGDSFELSTTSGGSAINITADGSGIVQAIAVEAFASAGTYSVTGGQITGV